MNINFENLEKIEDIYKILILIRDERINHIEKRWLTTEELSEYIGYSKESIKKMIREEEFEIGIHYHKKFKKNLFDKKQIDNWIIGTTQSLKTKSLLTINNIISDVA